MANEEYIYYVNIKNMMFHFHDAFLSQTVNIVAYELDTSYNFENINFKEGDIVVDIGGNVGMISIFLAKLYPFLKIYAFEPVRENYENFIKNIKLNNIPDGTIIVENKAVTKDGRTINMNINITNKGGSAISEIPAKHYYYQENNNGINSITLEEIFKKYQINKLKLLKIDCEDSEYEILYHTDESILKRIEHLRGEFYENKSLSIEYDIEELLKYCKSYINDIDICKCVFG